jgi:hypothetical protein
MTTNGGNGEPSARRGTGLLHLAIPSDLDRQSYCQNPCGASTGGASEPRCAGRRARGGRPAVKIFPKITCDRSMPQTCRELGSSPARSAGTRRSSAVSSGGLG